MDILCNSRIYCGDSGVDYPIANLSSEAPDQQVFIAINTGFWPYMPPIGSNWTVNSCRGICEAPTLEEALQCAARAQIECESQNGNWGTPPSSQPPSPPGVPPTTPTQTFLNTGQFCQFICPDGLPFTYFEGPNNFAAHNQAQADAMAHSYACQKAAELHVCLSSMGGSCCLGLTCTKGISANKPVTLALLNGALPPGMSFIQVGPASGVVTGIPQAGGYFSFTIGATDSFGNFIQKQYTLGVMDITNAGTLPNANTGDLYSYQLTATGGSAPYTFVLGVGSPPLPTGLSLSSSGLISGTCESTSGIFSCIIQVTSASGTSCSSTISIEVEDTTCFITPSVLTPAETCVPYSNFLQPNPSIVPDGGFALCYQVTAGALPLGLTLNFNTGEISGTAATPGTYNFTICICQN